MRVKERTLRLRIGIVAASLLAVTSIAYAEEPFEPQITLQELGQQCAASIGVSQVELRAAAIKEAKYQAEIARLRAEIAKMKESEKKP